MNSSFSHSSTTPVNFMNFDRVCAIKRIFFNRTARFDNPDLSDSSTCILLTTYRLLPAPPSYLIHTSLSFLQKSTLSVSWNDIKNKRLQFAFKAHTTFLQASSKLGVWSSELLGDGGGGGVSRGRADRWCCSAAAGPHSCLLSWRSKDGAPGLQPGQTRNKSAFHHQERQADLAGGRRPAAVVPRGSAVL